MDDVKDSRVGDQGELVLLVGFIGSGKSTWAKKYCLDESTIIINKDSLRGMFYGSCAYRPSFEPRIKEMVLEMCRSLLGLGYRVIVDETNLTLRHRDPLYKIAKSVGAKVAVVHLAEDEKNVDRRMNDPRGVSREQWEKVLIKQKDTFEPLTEEELLLTDNFCTLGVINGSSRKG